ncbi:helix-turn-helix domain-containing protein [Fodinicola acaciae]|uniref:helix-turn-helix domain-containing protein n=1 Tax=Fodinicola acaciae TaxID=2681555 RepID=UPI0013CF6BE5|nr:helix-turn-helix domain-containing protein [Fodinicola acaciae]
MPLELRDPAQFKALGHPLRHKLLLVLRRQPATLAQLAAALDSTKGTIGYHVRVLEAAGLLRVGGTRQVRGGTEQYYEPTSGGLTLHPDAPVGPEFLVRAALDEMVPGGEETTQLRHIRLTAEQARALAAELEKLTQRLGDDPTGESYGVLLSLYRVDIPNIPES